MAVTMPTVTDADLREMRLIAALCLDDETARYCESVVGRQLARYELEMLALRLEGHAINWPRRYFNVAPCSHCGSAIGLRCVNPSGSKYQFSHRARVVLANAIAADIVIRACESERARRAP